MATQRTDPWEKICKEIELPLEPVPFVSGIIPAKVIRKYGDPRLLIPVYSQEELNAKFPFLHSHGLCPFRTGIGQAVLTRAKLFQNLETDTQNRIEIVPPKEQSSDFVSFFLETPRTEAKFLAAALNLGIFHLAFDMKKSSTFSLGLFGKMNLLKFEVYLKDYLEASMHRIGLSNVQFELDLSLEDSRYIYLCEAKRGSARSFSVLQLFYPKMMLQKYAERTGRSIRTFLIDITQPRRLITRYDFFELNFKEQLVANSASIGGSKSVEVRLDEPGTASLDSYSSEKKS
jgi:hypothetical protein